ncbi:transcription antitermination factor NusB [Pseudoneobacillus rhizosphaerae]|uniref:Transcription antitermination protein NusB n=1 Tax=Pseudoneobacillus rhizosphaerae TaxID=2880968 RepID=A0A9C7GC56_9BACI|nr:transcription antitermination factor NusB [Pseudoneobacillus rhizosphaerae]CAG9609305.1 Transcription antitermination protein NusB [Pseudoneobacillus rhizosphaerae]
MKRRMAREKALQALFQIDMSDINPKEAIEHALEDVPSDPYLEKLVFGVLEHQEEIDQLITAQLEKWSLERLANVDRSVLRIAIFEMKYCSDEVPVNVILDEAIEIAKLYGDDQSSRFINGVLANIKQHMS